MVAFFTSPVREIRPSCRRRGGVASRYLVSKLVLSYKVANVMNRYIDVHMAPFRTRQG